MGTELQTPLHVVIGKGIFSHRVVLSFYVCYGAYSPELASLDYALFNKMKETLRGRKFPTNDDLERGVRDAVRSIPKGGALPLPKVTREMATVYRPQRGICQKYYSVICRQSSVGGL
jgi:hypothetical protein